LNPPGIPSRLVLGGFIDNRISYYWSWTYVKSPKTHKWQVPMDTLKIGETVISSGASNATLDTSVDYIQLNTLDFELWWNTMLNELDLT